MMFEMVKYLHIHNRSVSHDSLVTGVKTLVKLTDNLMKNPGNEKFGRVREKNPILAQRLLGKPGGIAALV